ncbi:hypothetical protein [Brevibacillus sp. SIMBA_040]|uniref:hypothetical protein n=1 Tax=unclassified Brevibacillus TaxID=2684853 RepID=UPI00397AFCBF
MHQEYMTLVRDDLLNRVKEGSMVINDSVNVPVRATVITSHPIIDVQQSIALQIKAEQITAVPVIKNLKLKTAEGVIVAEKDTNIVQSEAHFLSVSFVIQVKEGH